VFIADELMSTIATNRINM